MGDDALAAKRPYQRRRQFEIVARLAKGLEAQVFPHIERATKTLSPDIYDLDRLGSKITRVIVDKNFQRDFNAGKGRLAESALAAGVSRLVTELVASPEVFPQEKDQTIQR